MSEKYDLVNCEALIGKTISMDGVNRIALAAGDKDMLMLELDDNGAPSQYVVGHGVYRNGEELYWIYGNYYPIVQYCDTATALKNAVFDLIGIGWEPFPDRATVEKIRAEYTPGTKIELIYMKACKAPPPGTIGVVRAVDDGGSVLVEWSNGSDLSVILGKDRVRRI